MMLSENAPLPRGCVCVSVCNLPALILQMCTRRGRCHGHSPLQRTASGSTWSSGCTAARAEDRSVWNAFPTSRAHNRMNLAQTHTTRAHTRTCGCPSPSPTAVTAPVPAEGRGTTAGGRSMLTLMLTAMIPIAARTPAIGMVTATAAGPTAPGVRCVRRSMSTA